MVNAIKDTHQAQVKAGHVSEDSSDSEQSVALSCIAVASDWWNN